MPTARTRPATGSRTPAQAANRARNARAREDRRERWRPARDAAWELLDPWVAPGARVAIVGAGNAHDVPLGRLTARAVRVDLFDLDQRALRRAARRVPAALRGRVGVRKEDVTDGAADAVARRAAGGRAEPRAVPAHPLDPEPYDVVVADLFYTQLVYPALADAQLSGQVVGRVMTEHGQPVLDGVVARLHASGAVVVHLHDVLGWWAGAEQPWSLDTLLTAHEHDPEIARTMIAGAHQPSGCDVDGALARAGAAVQTRALWRWPFADGTDYAVQGIVAQTGDSPAP